MTGQEKDDILIQVLTA